VFKHARIERIVAVEGGYYLLDCYGQVYPAGKAIGNTFGLDLGVEVIRDLVKY